MLNEIKFSKNATTTSKLKAKVLNYSVGSFVQNFTK
jgi:hypothetical protein